MADPKLKYQRWYTNDYNSINAMRCPSLLGSVHNINKASDVINKIKSNLHDYALAYPIDGSNSSKAEGVVKDDPGKGPFYSGRDTTLGSNYFVRMGTCSNESENVCRGKPRYVYLRNIPVGGTFKALTGCNIQDITGGQGLLPGIVEDIGDLLDIGKAVGGNDNTFGSYKCARVTQPVGKNLSDSKMKCAQRSNDGPTYDELEACLYDNKNNKDKSNTNKSWWIETRCSPQTTEYRYTPEGFSDAPLDGPTPPDPWRRWRACLRLAFFALVVLALGYLLVASLCSLWGGARAFKNGARARMARRSDYSYRR